MRPHVGGRSHDYETTVTVSSLQYLPEDNIVLVVCRWLTRPADRDDSQHDGEDEGKFLLVPYRSGRRCGP